jgi:hypothetical protein
MTRRPGILRNFATPLLATLAVLYLSGCLVSEAVVHVLYDGGRDEFRQLIVYERFRYRPDGATVQPQPGQPPKPYDWNKDFAELQKIYAERAQTLFIEPSPSRLFGMIGRLVRTADGKLVEPWPPVAGEPPINFNDVTIKPGELFKDADGYLGYSHEMVVPGKFIDAALKSAVFHMSRDPSSTKQIADEIARRDAGGARLAWKDLIERTAAEVRKKAAGPGGAEEPAKPDEPALVEGLPDKNNPICYLEVASLKALQKTLADGTLDLGRRKSRLYVRLPLSPDDAKNAATLAAEVRKEALTARPDDKPDIATLRKKLREAADQGLTVELPAAGGLELSLDLPTIVNALSEALHDGLTAEFKKDPEEQKRAKEFADRADKEMQVKVGVTAQKLLADFAKSAGK